MNILAEFWWVLVIVFIVFSGLVTVSQGTIAVITMFGKYQRILRPGLNFKIPLIEQVFKTVSIQNRSVELEFQAVTLDQANVYFKSMLLYSVINQEEETIKNVAFKFINDKDLMQALIRTVEGSIRGFVATKRQAEILLLRREIVEFVKDQIDVPLESWGYHLQDLQINDITFDKVIMESMSRVVASNNLKAAAENEGQASNITTSSLTSTITTGKFCPCPLLIFNCRPTSGFISAGKRSFGNSMIISSCLGPYASSEGIRMVFFSPITIPVTPWSKPGITIPPPTSNSKGSLSASIEESKTVPSVNLP